MANLTIGQAIEEAVGFPYSKEYFSLMKESFELQLKYQALESEAYCAESGMFDEGVDNSNLDYYMSLNESVDVMYCEADDSVTIGEESFFVRLWNNIKKYWNRFISFMKKIFVGDTKKLATDEDFHAALKDHVWTKDDVDALLSKAGTSMAQIGEIEKSSIPAEIRDMAFAPGVDQKTKLAAKFVLAAQLSEGTFYFDPSGDSIHGSAYKEAKDDSSDGKAINLEDLIAIGEEYVKCTTEAEANAVEAKLRAACAKAEAQGLELDMTDEKTQKLIMRAQEIDQLITEKKMEYSMDKAKKKMKDDLSIKGKGKKVLKNVKKGGAKFISKMEKLCKDIIATIGKTIKKYTFLANLKKKIRSHAAAVKSFVTNLTNKGK